MKKNLFTKTYSSNANQLLFAMYYQLLVDIVSSDFYYFLTYLLLLYMICYLTLLFTAYIFTPTYPSSHTTKRTRLLLFSSQLLKNEMSDSIYNLVLFNTILLRGGGGGAFLCMKNAEALVICRLDQL
jgi:hypothetical protein